MKQAAASCRGLRGLQASHSKQQAVSPHKEELISCFCVWMKWKCTESGRAHASRSAIPPTINPLFPCKILVLFAWPRTLVLDRE